MRCVCSPFPPSFCVCYRQSVVFHSASFVLFAEGRHNFSAGEKNRVCYLCTGVCMCATRQACAGVGLCDLIRVCINCVLDQPALTKGWPVIINKLPVPAEIPPGPVSGPPPSPRGLSGQLPAGSAPFCSITANVVVCHLASTLQFYFQVEYVAELKQKGGKKKKASFLQTGALGS